MASDARKIIVIGGGIAGMCAAVYARKCGYEVEVLEQHDTAGGLATSWPRGDYRFETCLHWLVGSNPKSAMNAWWREVCDLEKLDFIDPEVFVRLETEHGESLTIYTNVDRLETELLQRAPEDASEIRHFISAIRRFTNFQFTMPDDNWFLKWLSLLSALPHLLPLWQWSRLSIAEYGKRFKNPLLRRFIAGGVNEDMSVLAIILSLAWMNARDAGYPIGGSQALIRLIVEKFRGLGGHLRLGAKVEKILVKDGAANGVELEGGEIISADRVISAADGHTVIYSVLGGRFKDANIDNLYGTLETFPSYLQVSLGVAKDLSDQPGFLTQVLDQPLQLDPETKRPDVAFRFFHYDPSFAPPGKTAVTCFLPTFNYDYWVRLHESDHAQYQVEKERIADAVIGILEKRIPDIRSAIETVDVSTPVTVIRYTGNWKGSMEGWLPTVKTGFRSLPRTLPGLRRFLMIGQWVMPGGGLPSGLLTARWCLQTICREDGVAFTPKRIT